MCILACSAGRRQTSSVVEDKIRQRTLKEGVWRPHEAFHLLFALGHFTPSQTNDMLETLRLLSSCGQNLVRNLCVKQMLNNASACRLQVQDRSVHDLERRDEQECLHIVWHPDHLESRHAKCIEKEPVHQHDLHHDNGTSCDPLKVDCKDLCLLTRALR